MVKKFLEGIKVFKEANKENLCQVSLTGIRSLILLGLLVDKPRSLSEIREEFIKYNIMEDYHSDDILRIDLNTLRTFGCEISRADKRTNNKFVLTKHPFTCNIATEELHILKRAFNRIKQNLDLKALLQFDALFTKLADNIFDKELKEELLGISPLKHYNLDIIKELQEDCKSNKIIKFIYKSPTSDKETEKNIQGNDIIMKNDKIYIQGFDINFQKAVSLNVDRIKSIISKKDNDNNNIVEKITVKFKLKKFNVQGLDDNENIINGTPNDGYLIEGKYHNEFLAYQRILSFGSDCTVLEPENFKQEIIEKLKRMRNIYNG